MGEEVKWKKLYIRDSNSDEYHELGEVTDVKIPEKPMSEMRKVEEGFKIDLKCSYVNYKSMAKLLGIKLSLWQRVKLFISKKYK